MTIAGKLIGGEHSRWQSLSLRLARALAEGESASRLSWVVLVIVLLLVVGSSAYGADRLGGGLLVAVMSFNIRYDTYLDGENRWSKRKGQVSEVIRRYSPDVLGVQEALRHQIDDIRKELPGFGEIGDGRDGEDQGEYSAILYDINRFEVDDSGTFWLSDRPGKPSRDWGNGYNRICTWVRLLEIGTGRAFYMYNTHLDHQSQAAREKSVRLIMAYIGKRKQQDPFVLTGDFNDGEESGPVKYLTGQGDGADRSPIILVDTFRLLHPNTEDVGTFNGFVGRTKGAKLDYIFTAPGSQVLEAAILRTMRDGLYPSDHYPVTATLLFGGGG